MIPFNLVSVHKGPGQWSLKLLRCRLRDAGLYQVRAVNHVGGAQHKFRVEVQCKEEEKPKKCKVMQSLKVSKEESHTPIKVLEKYFLIGLLYIH
jgi:hypothetical protein